MDGIITGADMKSILIVLLTATAMWIGGWVRSFLAKRVKLSGPLSESLERIEGKVDAVKETQKMQAENAKQVDLMIGSFIPALEVLVKKLRQENGADEPFNGDLKEATDEIACAKKIYREMREIPAGKCEEAAS